MSNHIEWLHASRVAVTQTAEPEMFNDGESENAVACIIITSEDGDGVCIEGRPDDLMGLAKRITDAAWRVKQETEADPRLMALYGVV